MLHRFSKQNAREMGRRGAEAKKRYKARAIAAEAAMEQERQRLLNAQLPTEEYLRLRIQRVRAQLDKFDAALLRENDPQRAQWLATVTMRLSEQERILNNRPNPGHLRPSAPRHRQIMKPLIPE